MKIEADMPTTILRRALHFEALPRRRARQRWVDVSSAGDSDQPAQRAGEAATSAAARPQPLRRMLVGLRVLIVDDDHDILDLFAAALTICGAETTATDNAVDALRLASATLPHVVVSDIAMMGEDGYWLVRELRGLPIAELARVPVIAATAYGREHSRSRVLMAGFDEHLSKPVDPETLCATVARLAGR